MNVNGNRIVRFLTYLFVLITALAATACNNKTSAPADNAKASSSQEAKPAFVAKDENLDDPSIYDQPRLQFAWAAPGKPKLQREIWSIKVDGSDLRRAADHDLIYFDSQGVMNNRPLRSPNNRYIVYDLAMPGGQRKYLINLKKSPKVGVFPTFNGLPIVKKYSWL